MQNKKRRVRECKKIKKCAVRKKQSIQREEKTLIVLHIERSKNGGVPGNHNTRVGTIRVEDACLSNLTKEDARIGEVQEKSKAQVRGVKCSKTQQTSRGRILIIG